MRVMSSSARLVLTLIWFAAFLLMLGVVVHLYFGSWIERDNFDRGVRQVIALYAPYLGAVTAFYFFKPDEEKPRRRPSSRFVVAVATSVIWNVAVVMFLLRLELGAGTIEEAIEQMADIGRLLAWLVSPAIGYYFAQPTHAAGEPST